MNWKYVVVVFFFVFDTFSRGIKVWCEFNKAPFKKMYFVKNVEMPSTGCQWMNDDNNITGVTQIWRITL